MIREEIIKTCLNMACKGLVIGTGGNVSVRTEKGFFITPSGLDYDLLTPDDIVELDFACKPIEGGRTPSIEKNLHREVLLARSDVSVVIHAHCTYATAVASCRRELPPLTDNQVAYFGGAVPVARYAPIGTDELAKNAAAALGRGSAVLLANHGALCVGHTLRETLQKCELLENLAKIHILAKLAGGGVFLTDEEVAREAGDLRNRYGQR